MSIDRTIDNLEQMGYFGQIDENLGQRLANGWNNMMSQTFGNNKAAGKLEIGQMVIGLEKDYKKWLGANGIKNPTRGDFNKFLGYVEQTQGVKFGAHGAAPTAQPAAAQPAQAAAPAAPASTAPAAGAAPAAPAQPTAAAQPAAGTVELTAANPTVTLNPNGAAAPAAPAAPAQPAAPAAAPIPPTNPMIARTLNSFGNLLRSGTMQEPAVTQKVQQIMVSAQKMGQTKSVIRDFDAMIAENPTLPSAALLKNALSGYRNQNESRKRKAAIVEANENPNQPFSMEQARSSFEEIARLSFNNAHAAGNPAAAGGGGQAGAAATDGSASPQTQRHASGSQQHVTLNMVQLDADLRTSMVSRADLEAFINANLDKKVADGGLALTTEGKDFRLTTSSVFDVLFAYLKAIATSN